MNPSPPATVALDRLTPCKGRLRLRVMLAAWKRGRCSVHGLARDVRGAHPSNVRRVVLELVRDGLLEAEPGAAAVRGGAVYRPTVSRADFLREVQAAVGADTP